MPVERKSGCGRLEGDWVGRNAGPHVPQRKRIRFVRVLDRPVVSSKSSKDGCTIAKETESKQARMVEQTFDDPDKRAKRKAVAWRKRWWRLSIFSACAMIASAERDCGELRRIMD